MGWIGFALLSGVLIALADAAIKVAADRVDDLVVVWAANAAALPLLLPAVLIDGLPTASAPVHWLLLGSIAGNMGAHLLIVRGIERTDLSVVIPLLGLVPVLVLLTAWLLRGEAPSALGGAGVLIIAAGSYLLRLDTRGRGWLEPFRALGRDSGARQIFGAVLILSFAAVADKEGVERSAGIFWSAAVLGGIALALTPVALVRLGRARRLPSLWPIGLALLAAGLLRGGSSLSLMLAYQTGLAAYVIALRRVNGPTSVLVGHLWFGEKGFRERLLGALVIGAGVALIALA